MAVQGWLATWERYYPRDERRAPASVLELDLALNEQGSFQVLARETDLERLPVSIRVSGPEDWQVRARRVGYVPMRHLNMPVIQDPLETDGLGQVPGYVPDPLYHEDTVMLRRGETHAFWVTLRPSEGAPAGRYAIEAELLGPEGEVLHRLAMPVTLHNVRLGPRQGFHITQLFYVDAILDWYRTDGFDARFWSLTEAYMRDMVAHGQNVILVPAFTVPMDGIKTPSQLVRVETVAPGEYRFDWSDVRRYVRLASAAGFDRFEWGHFFGQWGAQFALRVYEGQGRDERLLWPGDTPATDEPYRRFLTQFLPQFKAFMEQEGIFDRSLFHLSDEPHGEQIVQYGRVRAMMRELAPWMRTMDALTDLTFGQQGVVDTPIPSVHTALEFVAAGIPSYCYYCCYPREGYIQRLLDTPLPKIAMHGLLFYRWPFQGFLHWGYNYWYQSQTRNLIDPFCEQDGLAADGGGWAYGDPFQVYPGPDGPIDSLRWEVLAECLQDYRLLQTLGVSRDDPLLADLVSFDYFPKDANWRLAQRKALFARVDGG
jgi:hypothetical protein